MTLLVALGLLGQISKHVFGHDRALGFVPLFDLDRERNVPTFYSAGALLLCAALLAIIASVKRRAGDPFTWHWQLLALGFLYLATDEAMCIHELFIAPIRRVWATRGLLLQAWVMPAAAAVLVVGIAYACFLKHLPRPTLALFVTAGAVYLGGALGMEMLGGYVIDHRGDDNALYILIMTLEECMEMVGVVVFLHALMTYRAAHGAERPLRSASPASAATPREPAYRRPVHSFNMASSTSTPSPGPSRARMHPSP